MTTYRRKLIEVDLPLDDINRESAREKSIRHGHPSTLHLWWAPPPIGCVSRCHLSPVWWMIPLPALTSFPLRREQSVERERLHDIIGKLVEWESTDESQPSVQVLLANARYEIARSVARSQRRNSTHGSGLRCWIIYGNTPCRYMIPSPGEALSPLRRNDLD